MTGIGVGILRADEDKPRAEAGAEGSARRSATSRSRGGKGAGYKAGVKITRFKFDDHGADWHLEETAFDSFNLLVGVSGVGKTRILEALRRVCRMATGSRTSPGQIEWQLGFEHEGRSYQWDGRTGAKPSAGLLEDVSSEEDDVIILQEKLMPVGEVPLIERDQHGIRFRDQTMPPLADLGSAIHILKSEKELSAIRQGFLLITFSAARSSRIAIVNGKLDDANELKTLTQDVPLELVYVTLKQHRLTPIMSAYFLQVVYPEKFSEIKDEFLDIFSSLTDMRVELSVLPGDEERHSLQFAIQERGSSRWIQQSEISSGMLLTLAHIFEMALAPPGSVIVIDEFENSLGVNCMSDLARLISKRADCQVILTSHHPYIINTIPVDAWKLVTRKGGHVRVTSARDIPEMQSASRLEAFTRLINLPQFEEGIQ
jgi:hypothetical protein